MLLTAARDIRGNLLARFELSFAGGESLIIEHPASGLAELLPAFAENAFLLLAEIKVGSMPAAREVVVATRHVRLIRPLTEGSTQGSTFRPKR